MKQQRHQILINLCAAFGIPKLIPEFKFHPTRKWRFDFAIPEHKLAIEIDGGGWVSGRHNRESGRILEREKFNSATVLGWRVLHFTPKEVTQVKTLETIKASLY